MSVVREADGTIVVTASSDEEASKEWAAWMVSETVAGRCYRCGRALTEANLIATGGFSATDGGAYPLACHPCNVAYRNTDVDFTEGTILGPQGQPWLIERWVRDSIAESVRALYAAPGGHSAHMGIDQTGTIDPEGNDVEP